MQLLLQPVRSAGAPATDGVALSADGSLVEIGCGPAVVALVLIAVALAGLRSSRRRRHMRELERAVRQFGDGDLSSRVPGPSHGPADIRRLAGAFNDMADFVHVCVENQAAFVVDASHQLRNPLTVLNLRMEMLALRLEGEGREEAELIRDELNGLDVLLGRLLNIASARSALTVDAGPVRVLDLVMNRVTAWRPQAERRSVSLHVAAGPLAVIGVDATLVGSILDTLLDNAIKFSPEGGRVTVLLREDGPTIGIDVVDEGPGIAPADFERIDDRFWRSSTARDEPGAGLGLSIARELATVIGGRLTFTAVEPHGLCVGVKLPRLGVRPPGR
ncbi:sensor histidine kinase [Streptomyces sp. NPDC058092]|uniref:sensor histidine kinase n=1 Tax=Streptomyces sp. NPDC058092 TaxID=3346336 RepID=UPI0036E5AAF7